MRYRSLKVRDIGPFEKAKVEFADGLVVVIGPNGAGKSMLFECLYSGLTGDFRKFKTLAEFVRDIPGGKTKSGSTEVCFEHGGCVIAVRRTLSVSTGSNGEYKATQSANLKIETPGEDEPETVTGAKNVNARLFELLGDDINVMGKYAFIEQNKISALVDSDDAVRTKNLHALFGLDRFEKVWGLLGDEIKTLPDIHVADDLEAVRREASDAANQVVAATSDVATHEQALRQINDESAQRDIDTWESMQNIRDRMTAVDSNITSTHNALNSQQTLLSAERLKASNLERDLSQLQTRRDEANEFLARAATHDLRRQRLAALNNEADQVTAELRALYKPQPPSKSWPESEEQRLLNLQSRRASSMAFLKEHADLQTDDAKCPTCGQSIADLAAEIEKHKTLVQKIDVDLLPALEAKRSIETNIRLYELDSAKYTQAYDGLLKRASRITEENKKLQAESGQDVTDYSEEAKAAQRAVISEYDSANGALSTTRSQVTTYESSVRAAEASYNEAKAQKAAIQQELDALGSGLSNLDAEHIQRCRTLVRLASDKRVQVATARERLNSAEQHKRTVDDRLVRVEDLYAQAQRNRKVRSTLEDARTLFHREQLPAIIARRFLMAISQTLAQFLSMLRSEFTAGLVHEGGSYNFKCVFPDSTERYATNLSGGQKVRFSVALMMAIHSIMTQRLGVLAMDEPTAQLDAQNVQYLAGVLKQVRQVARNSGIQIIAVTHDPQLTGSADQTIEVVDGRVTAV